jgi:Tfp pilus assembly protein PilV
MRRSHGFTMIEVLASVLILMVGMLAVVGMVAFAIKQASRAQSASTAMATAMTVVDDVNPLLAADWTSFGSTTQGYLNGYYVRRTENSIGSSADLATNGLLSIAIQVDVYESFEGALVASLSTRRLARR